MAKPTASTSKAPIDTDEVLPEEIPGELLERVQENHPYLWVMSLQVLRGGTWKQLRGGSRTFNEQPPLMDVYAICTLLVRAAREDAESAGGEGTRYRVRLRCRNNGVEYSRFANVRGWFDDVGQLQIVDDAQGSDDNATMRMLQTSAQQSAAIAFQSLQAVMNCVKGFADIAQTFNSVLGAAGEQWATQVNSKVELLKVQMEMEQNSQQHAERMKKWDKGFAILEGPVGRIGDEIVEFAVEGMRAKRQKQRRERSQARAQGNGAAAPKDPPPRSEHAETLDAIFADLSEAKIAAVRDVMSPEEWKLVEVARRATTDQTFDAAFNRFYALLKQRGDKGINDWIGKLAQLVGPEAMTEIGMLIKRIERPEESASAS